ncbi:helix-turn-helix domain-containing protein [Oscillospiraceae bacterium OttesenSCG-928-F05]|nr:helix-turn-helix domain-containing protein [Oscillospiraceae bacterium OttesenSCG-928-F05]
MLLTIKDLLRSESLRDCTLKTAPGDGDAAVTGVCLVHSERTLASLRPGEAAVVDAGIFRGFRPDTPAFLDSLVHNGASVLFVEVSETFTAIPEAFLRKAEEHGLAVLETPWGARSSDIVCLLSRVLEGKAHPHFFEEISRRFRQFVLHGADMESIVTALADCVGAPVIYLGTGLHVICQSEPGFVRVTSPMAKCGDNYEAEALFAAGKTQESRHLVAAPVPLPGANIGFLAMAGAPADAVALHALHQAAMALSLNRMELHIQKNSHRNYQQELIDCTVGAPDAARARSAAQVLDVNIHAQYTAVVVVLEAEPAADDVHAHFDPVKYVSARLRAQSLRPAAVGRQNEQTVILIDEANFRSDPIREQMEAFAARLKPAPGEEASPWTVRSAAVGYCSTYAKLHAVQAIYQDAKNALEIGERIHSAPFFCDDFNRLGLYRLLHTLSRTEDLTRYLSDGIQRLSAYDKHRRANLVATLDMFFKHGRNAKDTAGALYIHPKTIAYRLERIREITGIDFQDGAQMFEAEVGLKILKMTENTEKVAGEAPFSVPER